VRRALITGITGQDGAYLAEELVARGVDVHGATRSLDAWAQRLGSIADRVRPHAFHASDRASIRSLLDDVRPTLVFNLAGPSFIPACDEDPEAAGDVLGLSVARWLRTILEFDPSIRFFQAGSSEIFGHAASCPQNETTPRRPRNAYGAAKSFAYDMVRFFRERHALFACTGILFNHESPRRAPHFVTRKITLAAARIHLGLQDEVRLGDLDAQRDWGFAGDYVGAMRRMLDRDRPDDFVIATGRRHSVRELCEQAFAVVGMDYRDHVRVDPAFVRPGETHLLCGDPSKALNELGWRAETPFEVWVGAMVEADLAKASADS